MAAQDKDAGRSYLSGHITLWQKRADDHREKQMINPFSEWSGASHRPVLHKSHPSYGRPVEGSMTELRGKKASILGNLEVVELCHVIAGLGKPQPDGTYTISFKELFEAYTRISSNLVGMLKRARKEGLVKFDGEMLYQRRDDNVVITCVQVPDPV